MEELIYHLIYQLGCQFFFFVNQHLYIHLEFSQIKLEAISCSSRRCNRPVCGCVGSSPLLVGSDNVHLSTRVKHLQYMSRFRDRAVCMVRDSTHPARDLFAICTEQTALWS